MGKNNKARRAAKAKERNKRQAQHAAGPGGAPFGWPGVSEPFVESPQQRVGGLWVLLEMASRPGGDVAEVRSLADEISRHDVTLVEGFAEEAFRDQLGTLWREGWQPEELRRHARRHVSAAAARLLELAVLADHDRRRGQRIDPRWAEQLRGFNQREISTRGSWFATWRDREGLARADAYQQAASVLALMGLVPPLDVLIPPPDAKAPTSYAGPPAGDAGGDPVLRRIRKLLAKAESTEFAEEASALTAKAHELMTRHAIDLALVAAPAADDTPRMIRLPIDKPYADAKSLLLAVVAEANRSRAVYLIRLEMSTVVGHAGDLAVVELMFTSLLVQAQHALEEAGRETGARARSQSFRSSFFVAYARRIEERLARAGQAVVDAAVTEQPRFLPVLRAREEAVTDFVASRYGDTLTSSSIRGGHDYAGSAFGRRAADDAALDSGELLW